MIINHNISALNAHRQLGANQSGVQGSLEKLSSGLQINKAGDDAAGLAISEKMRGQIRGLEMATKNAQDGISLIQTAEGALNETHSILQRMRELSVQSSSDTNTKEDRAELQKEVDQLAEEITRISSDTEFNTQTLLDGDFSATFQIGANSGQNISISVGKMSSDALKVGTQFTSTNNGTDPATISDGTTTATWEAAINVGDTLDNGDTATEDDVQAAGYYAAGELVLAADEATVTKGIDISSRDEADKAITTYHKSYRLTHEINLIWR